MLDVFAILQLVFFPRTSRRKSRRLETKEINDERKRNERRSLDCICRNMIDSPLPFCVDDRRRIETAFREHPYASFQHDMIILKSQKNRSPMGRLTTEPNGASLID